MRLTGAAVSLSVDKIIAKAQGQVAQFWQLEWVAQPDGILLASLACRAQQAKRLECQAGSLVGCPIEPVAVVSPVPLPCACRYPQAEL
jgi:hypothetical protein